MVEDLRGNATSGIDFVVVEGLYRDIILGVDFIKKFGLNLNLLDDEIIHGNGLSTFYKKFPEYRLEIKPVELGRKTDIEIEDKTIREMLDSI